MRTLKSKFIGECVDQEYLISDSVLGYREVYGATIGDIQEARMYEIPVSFFKLNVWPPPLKFRKGDVVEVVQGSEDIPNGSIYVVTRIDFNLYENKSGLVGFPIEYKEKDKYIKTDNAVLINPDIFDGGLKLVHRRFNKSKPKNTSKSFE